MNFPAWTGTYHTTFQDTERRRRILFKSPVGLFEFRNDEPNPLTLWLSETDWVRPFRRFDGLDWGSVPLVFQSSVSPLCGPRVFPLHDSCYEFHAWWTPRGMERITRAEADDMLYIGMRADGNDVYTSAKTSRSVKIGGGFKWEKDHDTLENLQREMSASMHPQGT